MNHSEGYPVGEDPRHVVALLGRTPTHERPEGWERRLLLAHAATPEGLHVGEFLQRYRGAKKAKIKAEVEALLKQGRLAWDVEGARLSDDCRQQGTIVLRIPALTALALGLVTR